MAEATRPQAPRRTPRVLTTAEFKRCARGLDAERRAKLIGTIARIAAGGPTLGRPHVDVIHGSRVRKLKEARVDRGMRVLFAFDSNRNPVMLVGGDKTGKWNRWYPKKIESRRTPLPRSRAKHRKGGLVSESTRSWKDFLTDESVNEMRAELYERLMEAQERIAHAQYRRGVDHEVVRAALDTAEERLSEAERREDLYLSALAHYVEALGGRLEVRAVFGDEAIVIRREPDEKRRRWSPSSCRAARAPDVDFTTLCRC